MTRQHESHGTGDGHAVIYDLLLPEALRGVELGDDVLELGPGPGLTTDVLRARTMRLTAVEFDHALASSLAARLAGSNVDVVEGDAAALAFADDHFSGAAAFSMLHHVEPAAKQDQVFAELARVLRPGGALVATDGVHTEGSHLFGEFNRYSPLDPSGLAARLQEVGFVDIEVRTLEGGWWVCTARAA
jgi:SAM-dependent methyltransferase